MRNNLNGVKENASQPIGRHKRGTFKFQHPLYKPSLRSWQPLAPKRGRETVARALRPFGDSEARVEVLTKGRYPAIRILEAENGRQRRHLDLRKSDIPSLINGLHGALAALGGR